MTLIFFAIDAVTVSLKGSGITFATYMRRCVVQVAQVHDITQDGNGEEREGYEGEEDVEGYGGHHDGRVILLVLVEEVLDDGEECPEAVQAPSITLRPAVFNRLPAFLPRPLPLI